MAFIQPDIHYKRAKRQLLRSAVDVPTLEKTYMGVCSSYDRLEKKHHANMKRWKKTGQIPPGSEYRLQKLHGFRRGIDRLYNKLHRTLRGVIETRNRLFKDCGIEEREGKLQAFLRIPPAAFRHFDKLGPDVQDAELQRLVDEYGAGSKNAGFAPSLLNMPGWTNAHLLGSKKEQDGSRRRAIFQHEMIDRLIYAAMHPQQYKPLFFTPTKKDKKTGQRKVTKRWNDSWRQMRSEGRLSMIRVLIVLIMRMDFKKTLRTGKWSDGDFVGLSRADISDLAGISVHAVKAALRSLVSLNILYSVNKDDEHGKQPRESYLDDASVLRYKGLPVVRKFTMGLIAGLSLHDQYKAILDWDKLTPEQRDEISELLAWGDEQGVDVTVPKAKLEIRHALA